MLAYDQARNDDARLYWTLQDGSLSLRGIYATLRHLRSTLSMSGVQELLNSHVRDGNLTAIPHPTHSNEYFYRLSPAVIATKNNGT